MDGEERGGSDKLGVEFLADGPEQFDATLQTPIVDAMIARGIDALLIAATDKQAMVEPMRRAYDAGIKVISVDTFVGDGDYVNGPNNSWGHGLVDVKQALTEDITLLPTAVAVSDPSPPPCMGMRFTIEYVGRSIAST